MIHLAWSRYTAPLRFAALDQREGAALNQRGAIRFASPHSTSAGGEHPLVE